MLLWAKENARSIDYTVWPSLWYVHWTEQRTYDTEGEEWRTETVHYSDSETILNNLMIQLWGDGKHSQQLAAGRYAFPFKYQLPSNLELPTSYESSDCYTLTAIISRSWKFNYTTKRAIIINEIIDINTPKLTVPLSNCNEKTLRCLCCTYRGGYCPGESIAISTEAENHSNRRITVEQAMLKQLVVYYAQGQSHANTNDIQKVQGSEIAAGNASKWSNELLPIPATFSYINSCCILKLYVLQVALAIPRSNVMTCTLLSQLQLEMCHLDKFQTVTLTSSTSLSTTRCKCVSSFQLYSTSC